MTHWTFVRHASSTANRDRVLAGRLEVALAPEGLRQAAVLHRARALNRSEFRHNLRSTDGLSLTASIRSVRAANDLLSLTLSSFGLSGETSPIVLAVRRQRRGRPKVWSEPWIGV